MIGLANERPTKKITSEQEISSGQSLLIFQQNWKGVYSQFEPFTSAVEAHDEALSIIAPYFPDDQPGATPYRAVDNEVRGEIVQTSYRLRDALIDAADTLAIGTFWNTQ
jgi:iron uptake system component EfeO